MRTHQVQDDQLWLRALRGKNLRRHLEQCFVFGIFIGFKIPVFQELHFIGTLRDAGNGGIVFANLPLIREPPRLKTGTVCQRDKVILILWFAVDNAVQGQAERFLRRAAGRNIIGKQGTVDGAGERRVIPVSAERAHRIAACAFADDDHIGMVLRLHRQHVPGVFHIGELSHARLLVENFLVIDDNVFYKAEHRVAGILQLEHAAPGQVLHGGDKEGHHAECQA